MPDCHTVASVKSVFSVAHIGTPGQGVGRDPDNSCTRFKSCVATRGYPRETLVAEKFQAMIEFGMANSRMKDFL